MLSVGEPTHKSNATPSPLFFALSPPCVQKEYFPHSNPASPFLSPLLEGKAVSIFSWSQFFEGLGFRASLSWSLLPVLPVRGAPMKALGCPWDPLTDLEGGALRKVVMQDHDHPLLDYG